MKSSDCLHLGRREFISLIPGAILGSRVSHRSLFSPYSSQTNQNLREELTPGELKRVEKSVLAQDIKNYFREGYSCAESLLKVSLKFLRKPEDLVWAACGFGGGMYQKDLCGFLTSGIMVIGLSAGMLKKERKESKEICIQFVEQYWKWWASQAPLHCSEIRKPTTNPKVCSRLSLLASAKIEELITSIKSTV
ncbi:MAG: C_GCAxxG_C_C family protein [Candidatus Aminicenantes bacterium]|nr:MAG: C_GCAxxG_C_C family protein [Candidatus Aminicenantes bacterium]